MNSNNKIAKSILIIAGYILLGYNQLFSQPYYFYFKPVDERKNISVYRFDLSNGTDTRFTNEVFRSAELDWDLTQTWLYVYPEYGSALVISIAQPSIVDTLPSERTQTVAHVMGAFLVPQEKKFYVTWTPAWGSDTFKTYIYSSETFDSLGTVDELVGNGGILSRDGTKLYYDYGSEDTLNGIDYLYTFSTISNVVVDSLKFLDIGPKTEHKATEDGKAGTLLIKYYYPSLAHENTYYFLYDIETKTSCTPVHFPFRSYAFLSGDTENIIIEQVNWDTTRPSREYRPGDIFVFDSHAGTLLQRLKLPPEGKILLFDNYPNMLYYYLPGEQRSINIDLSKLANITSLSPAFAYAGSNAFTLTVSGKNFANGSIVNWGGVAKTATFVADSILQAGILASDIAVIDSPLVTVKNADGSAESNSIRFYIKQPPPITGCNVKLINSTGAKLTGGSLQYYEGGWRDAVNNSDGTFFVNTTAKTISLRMTYEYGAQTKSNVTVGPDTVVFQTVNAQIQLQDSKGSLIDMGTVQYYAGAWRSLGTTAGGIASKELLPGSYSFRMTYAYASKDKQQDIGTNPTVVFQTTNASVQLQDSQGTLMDQGTVRYYSGAWRDFGVTTDGVASKELLPNNYSFRMSYSFASKEKQQDIAANPTVVFQTVNATVQLENSQGSLIDQGTVQYYAGAWRDFGTTTGGAANKELLPNNYSFRMTYEYVSLDKTQDLSTNSTVSFSTVLSTIRVKNSQSQPVDGATVSYYSGAWRQIGTTVNGEVTKELLPVNLTFRVNYGTQQQDKTQNLSTSNVVEFTIGP